MKEQSTSSPQPQIIQAVNPSFVISLNDLNYTVRIQQSSISNVNKMTHAKKIQNDSLSPQNNPQDKRQGNQKEKIQNKAIPYPNRYQIIGCCCCSWSQQQCSNFFCDNFLCGFIQRKNLCCYSKQMDCKHCCKGNSKKSAELSSLQSCTQSCDAIGRCCFDMPYYPSYCLQEGNEPNSNSQCSKNGQMKCCNCRGCESPCVCGCCHSCECNCDCDCDCGGCDCDCDC